MPDTQPHPVLKNPQKINALDYGNRLTAAHREIRLMLLGSPPDMVHSTLLHRVCPHKREHLFVVVCTYLSIILYLPEKIKWFVKKSRQLLWSL